MTTLLRIDSSARDAGSYSRRLGDAAEAAWLRAHPGARVIRRDLGAAPVPHLDGAAMGAAFTPAEARTPDMRAALAFSERLVDELLSADTLLLTVPMYNFGIPSALKAWLDHVVRVGRTFSYDGKDFAGLATGRDAVLALAYGAPGYGPGGPLAAADFALPYLRFALGFIGLSPVQAFAVEGTSAGAAVAEASLAAAVGAVEAAYAPIRAAA